MCKKSILLIAMLSSLGVNASQFYFRTHVSGIKPEPLDNRSCSTLLEQNSLLLNGYYELIKGNYYCDMYSGGYTLIENINITNTEYVPGFTRKSDFASLTNYPASTSDALAFWLSFPNTSNGVFNKVDLVSNVEGFEWSNIKISYNPQYFGSPDGYYNSHGIPYNRDSLSGMFVDGFSISSESNLIAAFASIDLKSRRDFLGIPDNKSFIGRGSFTVKFNQESSVEKITLRGMLDQASRDEDAGFSSYKVWIR